MCIRILREVTDKMCNGIFTSISKIFNIKKINVRYENGIISEMRF